MHSAPRIHRHRLRLRAKPCEPAARILVTVMRPIPSCLGHLSLRAKPAGARLEGGSPKASIPPLPRPLTALLALLGLCPLLAFGDCGRSQPLQCTSNKECPSTQICTPNQQCTPKVAECATDRECGIHYRCEHFDCIPVSACKNDFDCSPPDRCKRKNPNDTHGSCETLRECPQACPALHFCGADLRCIPNGACGSDQDCRGDTQCDHGRCRALLCKSHSDCRSPRRCEAIKGTRACRLPKRCRYDQDCTVNQECKDKICAPQKPGCKDCKAPSICVHNRCLPPKAIRTDSGSSAATSTQ